MELRENVPLSSLTTFKLGGFADVVLTCTILEDIQMALAYCRERHLAWYVLGGGSNLLVNDAGYRGAIIHLMLPEYYFEDGLDKNNVQAVAEAGVSWDGFVQASVARGLWGLENLAGIPGSVGASPVQNIGAYGVEVRDTIAYVDAFNTVTNEVVRFTNEECNFGYRDSLFKHDSIFIVVRVAFNLSKISNPRIEYADLVAKAKEGIVLDTPQAIADAVRTIRAQKFPDLSSTGTAGSFFKNPVISREAYDVLLQTYPELPGYSISDDAQSDVKVSLAWILDKALHLKGFSHGVARLFEKQPLVVVAEEGASANDVDALAYEVSEKVFAATNIKIEREVRSL